MMTFGIIQIFNREKTKSPVIFEVKGTSKDSRIPVTNISSYLTNRQVCLFEIQIMRRNRKFASTFNNISGISWRSVLLVEEAGVPVASHWQTLSHNVVSSTPRHDELITLVVIVTECTGSYKIQLSYDHAPTKLRVVQIYFSNLKV